MFSRVTTAALVVFSAGSLISLAGCSSDECCESASSARRDAPARTQATADLRDWPADAVPGECYAKAYIPPVTQTCTEQVLSRAETRRLEIVPAQYEWVEERVMVKDASFALAECPAKYKTEQVTVQVKPAETGWFVNTGSCKTVDGKMVNNVFCYVTRPPETQTLSKQVVCKGATVEKTEIPAEYTTVRRQKLVAAATTKTITIPAEYGTIQRTVVSAPARWEWQRVICDHDPITMNAVKRSLVALGYPAGPCNGEMTEQDWTSVKAFQLANGLGVGNLSHETLEKLQVSRAK